MRKHRRLATTLAAAISLGAGPGAAPSLAAVTPRLPDLAAVAPFDFRIVVRSDGTRRLRFSSVIANIGQGPFQIYGYDEDGTAVIGDDLRIRQQVLQANGTWVERNTTATMFWSGDGHQHFHAQGLTNLKLSDSTGREVARTRKIGFCFLDSYAYGSTRPSRYNSTNFVCVPAPNGRVPMGVSVRWADIYRSTIAHQWIDITGLPNGVYRVEVVADPPWKTGGRFIESNESNNRGWAKIRISGTTVTVLSRSAKP